MPGEAPAFGFAHWGVFGHVGVPEPDILEVAATGAGDGEGAAEAVRVFATEDLGMKAAVGAVEGGTLIHGKAVEGRSNG
jgi:hypothetical protein